MNPLKIIDDLITEHGSSKISKERILLLKEQLEALIKEITDLKAKNAQLEKETGELTAQLKSKTSAEEFTEHRGALFKRKADGSYHLSIYCPSCHGSTGALVDEMPFSCNKPQCKWKSSFTKGELEQVIKELYT